MRKKLCKPRFTMSSLVPPGVTKGTPARLAASEAGPVILEMVPPTMAFTRCAASFSTAATALAGEDSSSTTLSSTRCCG